MSWFIADNYACCLLFAASLSTALRTVRTILFSLVISFYAGALFAFSPNAGKSSSAFYFILLLFCPLLLVSVESLAFKNKRDLILCSFLLYLGFDALTGLLEAHGFKDVNMLQSSMSWFISRRLDIVAALFVLFCVEWFSVTRLGCAFRRLNDTSSGHLLFGIRKPALIAMLAIGLAHLLAWLAGVSRALRVRPSYEDALSFFFFSFSGALLADAISRPLDRFFSTQSPKTTGFYSMPIRAVAHGILMSLSIFFVLKILLWCGGIEWAGKSVPMITCASFLLLTITMLLGERRHD